MSSFLNSVSHTISGTTEKAYILVRQRVIEEKNAAEKVTGALSSLADMASSLKTTVNSVKSAVSKVSSLLNADSAIVNAANDKGFMAIKVQYNPSSIHINGFKDGKSISHDQGYQDHVRAAANILSMELIFDKMDDSTAFMLDKSFSVVDTVSSTILGNNGADESVQYIVELLIGAMVNTGTRWIGFAWGDQIIWGELINLEATYTMFDMNGVPVRAKVNMSIREDKVHVTDYESNGEKEMGENRQSVRKEEKNDIKELKKKAAKSTSWTSTASNILNLKL